MSLGKKNHTHASLTKIQANCISEESLINAVYDKNKIEASFLLRKCQEPVRRETTEGSFIEVIGCCSTSKMVAQCKICQAFAIF